MANEVYNGSQLRIKVNSKLIYHATDAEISVELGTKERATKDTSGVEVSPDLISWSASGNALGAYDLDTAEALTHNEFEDLFDLMIAKTLVPVEFTLGTSGTTGDTYYTGNAYITSLSLNATVREDATASFQLTGSGVPGKDVLA